MAVHRSIPEHPLPLRREAEVRLQQGTAPKAKVVASDFPALSVLQDMATVSGGASAALKLLHELQVHQVELDLQHEQLEQSRDELGLIRDEYVARFDFAPVAYCVVGRDGRVMEGNKAAAAWLGMEPTALRGRLLGSMLAPQSQVAWRALLKQLCDGGAPDAVDVQVESDGQRRHRIVATPSPDGRSFMVMLIDLR